MTGVLAIYTYKLWSATSENAQRQLRAYVDLLEAAIRNDGAVVVNFKNAGQTPAHDMGSVLRVAGPDHPDPAPWVPESKGPISTGGTAQMIQPLPAFQSALTTWVLGEARYKDVFGKEHTTRFCTFHTAGDPPGRLKICGVEGHNTAD